MNVLTKVNRAMRRAYRGFEHQRTSSKAFAKARQRLLESSGYSEEEKKWLNAASLRVHRNDLMFKDDSEHYLSSGISGMRCIREALETIGKGWEGLRILDFPCGYGRVLRFLRLACPTGEITACEIDEEAVHFCEREFGAVPAMSAIPVQRLVMEQRFDLIWCGSLLTHVDEPEALGFLRFFEDHLSEGGVCLFTTHGQVPVDWMRSGQVNYGLPDAAREAIVADYDDGLYGYANYPNAKNYGISAACPNRMRALAGQITGWEECLYLDHGWDQCQDVYAYRAPGGT